MKRTYYLTQPPQELPFVLEDDDLEDLVDTIPRLDVPTSGALAHYAKPLVETYQRPTRLEQAHIDPHFRIMEMYSNSLQERGKDAMRFEILKNRILIPQEKETLLREYHQSTQTTP